jgi:tetratricopeptide (TPR) repeat protein
MPSTVNGIGTHYYGRKNVTVRSAQCKSCQRVGNLESYDTRLFFVVVFIPVIPLGRKRIIDHCRACTRHYALSADQYEQSKQLNTSGSLEKFRRQPSPDAAIEAHGQLLGFHEMEQAAEFRKSALKRYPDHAGLRSAMASQLQEMSIYDECAKLYQAAYDLDPDLPDARVGVAFRKMSEGKLDEAQELLGFLEEPGASRQYSLQPIDILSGNLQKAGRHEESMRIARVLLRELPALENIRTFRKSVRKSEKALGVSESILPKRGFSVSELFRSEGSPYAPWQRYLAIGTVATILILGGLAANNEYIRRHRTLHILNATGEPSQVQVDDLAPVTVSGRGEITVPEGSHIVKVTGPVNEAYKVGINSGYLDRWLQKPAWVVNVGGEAVLEELTHIYSANPAQGGSRRLLVGETVFHRPNVDCIFTAPPSTLKLKNNTDQVTMTELSWAQLRDVEAFLDTIDVNHGAAMTFAAKRLRRGVRERGLLDNYLARSTEAERPAVEELLKSDLDRRPVDIAWHRAYQSIAEFNKHEAELIPRYDQYLAANPKDAAFLYLRGRIDPNWDKQASYYERAIAADPKLSWPWMALAVRAASEGRWDDCLGAARKADELGLVDQKEMLADLVHKARMANGEAEALVTEYRVTSSPNEPPDAAKLLFLIDALSASGKASEIDAALNAWLMRIPPQFQGQAAPFLRAPALYYAGKLEACVNFCKSNMAVKSSPTHLQALLALGRMKDATEDSLFSKLWEDPTNLLCVSIGFALEGKKVEAAEWRKRAAELFHKVGGGTDLGRAGVLLEAKDPPSMKQIHKVYYPAESKTIFLASLADKFPENREIYLTLAARLNVSRRPSYYLTKRVLETKAAKKP